MALSYCEWRSRESVSTSCSATRFFLFLTQKIYNQMIIVMEIQLIFLFLSWRSVPETLRAILFLEMIIEQMKVTSIEEKEITACYLFLFLIARRRSLQLVTVRHSHRWSFEAFRRQIWIDVFLISQKTFVHLLDCFAIWTILTIFFRWECCKMIGSKSPILTKQFMEKITYKTRWTRRILPSDTAYVSRKRWWHFGADSIKPVSWKTVTNESTSISISSSTSSTASFSKGNKRFDPMQHYLIRGTNSSIDLSSEIPSSTEPNHRLVPEYKPD